MPEPQRPTSSKASAPADSDESPKHSRRERKPATERYVPELEPPSIPDDSDRGRKRRLQDPLPLEDNVRGGEGRNSARRGLADHNSNSTPVNSTHVPRSSHYFQHDDRGAVTSGRNNRRRAPDDRWTEHSSKSRFHDKSRDTIAAQDRKNTNSQAPSAEADDAWTHDKFLEMQSEGPDRKRRQSPLQRVRPIKREFREHPIVRSDNKGEQKNDYPERKTERRHPDMNSFRRERGRYRQRVDDLEGGRWMDSDRYQPRNANSRYVGDDHHHGGHVDMVRNNNGSTAIANQRWTHDMFEELNRSPSPKHEEDSIAQIEALLAA